MYSEQIKDVLRIARTKDDIDCILLNLEDFYDLLDGNTFNRIDPVTIKGNQKIGQYAHIDGFTIYCSKKCPEGKFALATDAIRETQGYGVTDIKDLKWTDYAPYYSKYQFPKVGQRYSFISAPQRVIEITGIRYNDTRYSYLFDAVVLQVPEAHAGFYDVNEPMVLESLDKYQYLPGQDKPIV